MKRLSIVGPLLLIAAGGLSLAHNIRPDLISWEMVARYWPYVLIGWGALRLVEIGVWWARGAPLPRHGISGGEWAIAILICLVGSGATAAHKHAGRFPNIVIRGGGLELFGETFSFPVSREAPAANVRRIIVEIPRGNTRIQGADVQEVRVSGQKNIRSFDRSEAENTDRQTPLEIVTEGEQIVVRIKDDAVWHERRVSADLEVTVPRGASIRALGRYGDFDVTGIDGSVAVQSANAGVRLGDIGGNVKVDLRRSDVIRAVNVKGDVELFGKGDDIELENIAGAVRINGYFSGDLQCRNLSKPLAFQSANTELNVERVAGELNMDLSHFNAKNVSGPLSLRARSRDVRIEDFTGSVRVKVERGDVELLPGKSPMGEIEVATHSGNVELTLPSGAQFELAASTDRGDVTNDFGPPLTTRRARRGAELTGSQGNGPRININTHLGSITVGKS